MVSMTEQTEVLMRAKTAGFSGAVIACWGCSGWGPGVSARAFLYSDQGVDPVVLGGEDACWLNWTGSSGCIRRCLAAVRSGVDSHQD